jgi:uncharacterized membrane protein YoaK (UPF0700 family)
MKAVYRASDVWLSLGLAFAGGYGDSASFVLANTFTGHVTGAFVLAAISVASHDWPTCSRRFIGIALFVAGILCSATLRRFAIRKPPWFLFSSVMGIEIVLISAAYFAMTSHVAFRLELFVSCMSLALGLQNGAWQKAGAISVHTTYLTGMLTDLLTSAAERSNAPAALDREPEANLKASLHRGIWLAFVLGAGIGAAMVFRFEALGILGIALPLAAIMIASWFMSK